MNYFSTCDMGGRGTERSRAVLALSLSHVPVFLLFLYILVGFRFLIFPLTADPAIPKSTCIQKIRYIIAMVYISIRSRVIHTD